MNKWKESLAPLLNLLPALAVIALIAATLPLTRPVLAAIPERLTALAEAAEPDETAEIEEKTLESDTALPTYVDGVYTGSAQGYGGVITVQVTVEDGKITAIEILDASGETDTFLSRATGVIDRVLASQTWEVDVISGATYSSNGILGAIQNALTGEEAEEAAEQPTVTPLSSDAFTDAAAYADGVYTGSAQGFGGQITVQVTVSGGVMTAVEIVSASGETASYLARAEGVISAMLASGSPNVDVVSGATYSSTGIINAVKRALNKAAVDGTEAEEITEVEAATETEAESGGESTAVQPSDITAQPAEAYADGVYTGTGTGFGGDITVQVTVEGGLIVSITILSAEDETPVYLTRASGIISSMLTAQRTDVDAISGATYSSEGIREAVQNALKQALADDSEAEEADPEQEGSEGVEDSEEEESGETELDESGDKAVSPVYADGVYSAQALCTDEDFFSYWLQVDVTIMGGLITGVDVSKYDDVSDDPESNETYLNYAIYGRTYRDVWYEGIVSQVLARQSGDGVDVVSRATYSSNAIITGVQDALVQASAAANREEEPS